MRTIPLTSPCDWSKKKYLRHTFTTNGDLINNIFPPQEVHLLLH